MKVTNFTKTALASRREKREMEQSGFEFVGENGGKIWELNRGYRWNKKITEVKISHNGKGVWIKIE